MARYIGKRFFISLITILVLVSVTFFLIKLLPGDPFMNDKVAPEIRQRQLAYYGLDKPVAVQYIKYLGNLMKGDLGTSLKYVGRQVTTVIGETFPASLTLGLIAVFFSQIIGMVFGILSAQFNGKWPDYVLMLVAVFGVAVPSMVLGPLIRYFFGVRLHWLPVTGWGSPTQIIMPAFVMGLGNLAGTTRRMRASMLGVTTQDYVKTARSKGLTATEVIWRHELKNSMIPIVTSLGATIANMIMGSFVVEQIFVIPGLGKHFVNAVTTLDYPLVMGTTIFYGTFLVFITFFVDLVYGVVDPRIRLS